MSIAEITNGSHEGLRTTASTVPNGRTNGRKSRNITESLSPPEVALPSPAVSLVVPARNEARNIPWVFEQIPDCVDEVILVDGDSVDATVPMATHCLPTVRSVKQNGPGKGNALRTGFLAATGDYVVMMDADGSMSPAEIPHYLHFLENGYDFVKGSRFVAGGGSLDITRFRRLGNRVLLAAVNRLYDASLTDLCYGFCAFRRSFLDQLDLHAAGFEIEAEMIVHALRRTADRRGPQPRTAPPRGRSNLRAFRTAPGFCVPSCATIAPASAATSCSRYVTAIPLRSLHPLAQLPVRREPPDPGRTATEGISMMPVAVRDVIVTVLGAGGLGIGLAVRPEPPNTSVTRWWWPSCW